MCGIFGEFGNELISKEEFSLLNLLSSRRGPDMEGYWMNNEFCQFGFNRLSIIDLSIRGNQPMISRDKRWVMVFNGEVYNYSEIRDELGCSPDDFNSKTDVEVVLRSFQNWGIDKTLEKLNGIYAIALLDQKKSILHLIRDFAGVKPLYFGIKKEKIIFASQYDQIFNHPLFINSRIPNQQSLYDYIQFGYVQAPNAFFKDTWQVEPGQVVSISRSLNISKRKYFEFSSKEKDLDEMDELTISGLDNSLKGTVKRQLISDVPVGLFLSGGIDSPLITYYVNQVNPQIETFTIGSLNPIINEANIARKYAEFLNVVNHQYYYSNETLVNDIDEHFKAYSEPFGDYSSLPAFQVCKMAKSHFSVILGGDGGDEIFWGYPRFQKYASHFSWFNFGSTMKRISAGLGRKMGYKISYGIHMQDIGKWVAEGQSHNNSLVLSQILPQLNNSNYVNELYRFPRDIKNKNELLTWLRWNEYYGHLQRILLKIDRASMYHGIEVRVPFLDRDILNYALRVRPKLSIKHEYPKYLLKQLMSQKYPMYAMNNKKMGFEIDIDNSLRTILKEEVYDLLLGRDPYPINTFNRKYLNKYIRSYFEKKSSNEWGIWILFALQKWAQSFDIRH